MPVRYSVDPERALVTLTYEGEPTFVETQATIDAALACGDLKTTSRVFVDRRGQRPPSSAYMRTMVDYVHSHRQSLQGTRWAIAVNREELASYGLARMAQILLSEGPIELRVFKSADAAIGWLLDGVEPAPEGPSED